MPERRTAVPVTFDGEDFEAYDDESVLQAARRNGIAIPALCYLEGLSVWGGCRVCVVEVAEDHRLRPACATPVKADMEIKVHTPRLDSYRKSILELLFAEGNHVCAVCVSNGRCELQDTAVEVGMDHVRYDQQAPARKVDASHAKYVFDHNRCILCTRCVRVCDEIEGAHVWDIAERGAGSEIIAEMDVPWGDAKSCTWCGKCVAACPTGSLFYHGKAVGEMEHSADIIRVLASARGKGEWLSPEVSL